MNNVAVFYIKELNLRKCFTQKFSCLQKNHKTDISLKIKHDYDENGIKVRNST